MDIFLNDGLLGSIIFYYGCENNLWRLFFTVYLNTAKLEVVSFINYNSKVETPDSIAFFTFNNASIASSLL